jgi:hypothetical protein
VYASMFPTSVCRFDSPASDARCCNRCIASVFMSTATNCRDGKSHAKGRVKLPAPLPKSTKVTSSLACLLLGISSSVLTLPATTFLLDLPVALPATCWRKQCLIGTSGNSCRSTSANEATCRRLRSARFRCALPSSPRILSARQASGIPSQVMDLSQCCASFAPCTQADCAAHARAMHQPDKSLPTRYNKHAVLPSCCRSTIIGADQGGGAHRLALNVLICVACAGTIRQCQRCQYVCQSRMPVRFLPSAVAILVCHQRCLCLSPSGPFC